MREDTTGFSNTVQKCHMRASMRFRADAHLGGCICRCSGPHQKHPLIIEQPCIHTRRERTSLGTANGVYSSMCACAQMPLFAQMHGNLGGFHATRFSLANSFCHSLFPSWFGGGYAGQFEKKCQIYTLSPSITPPLTTQHTWLETAF